MRLKFLFCILLLSSVNVSGQLKVISSELLNIGDKNKLPNIPLNEISEEGIELLMNNPNVLNQVPIDEQIVYLGKEGILTSNVNNAKTILRYSGWGTFQRSDTLLFSEYDIILPFHNGGIAAVERWEGGGNKIQIFSRDFQLRNSYTLFKDGYDGIQLDIKDNLLLVGARSVSGGKPKLMLLNDEGEQLFSIVIFTDGDISKVLCSTKYLIAYCFDQASGTHEIFVYNRSGKLLWSKKIDRMVNMWACNVSESPYLVIGFQKLLAFIDIDNAETIRTVKLDDIYLESGISKYRQDNYVEIVAIEIFDHTESVVLLAEPLGNNYKNIVLFTFNPFSSVKSNAVNIGESYNKPILKFHKNRITIIKNNEVIKFGM